MDLASRILRAADVMAEAGRIRVHKTALPDKDTAALMTRLEGRMSRWGAWGHESLGYDGGDKAPPDANESYGLATREIDAWAKMTKYVQERHGNALYWTRGENDPVLKLTLHDGEPGMQFIRVTFLMPQTAEAQNIIGGAHARVDRIFADWVSDASRLSAWLRKVMRHNVVSISGMKGKADRFNVDMDQAQLQKLIGVITRFAAKQGNLKDTVKEEPGEREFARSVHRTWQSPNREVGVTMRADEYIENVKVRHRGKGYYVTVLMWPTMAGME